MSTVDLIVRAYRDLDHRPVVEIVYVTADHAAAHHQLDVLHKEAASSMHFYLHTVPLNTDLTKLASYPVFEADARAL